MKKRQVFSIFAVTFLVVVLAATVVIGADSSIKTYPADEQGDSEQREIVVLEMEIEELEEVHITNEDISGSINVMPCIGQNFGGLNFQIDDRSSKLPVELDTDQDGLSDSIELDLDLDPYDWDTDNDLISDGIELGDGYGSTSPYLKDSDNDGLEDPWEDNDLDGMMNLEEQNCIWLGRMDPNTNDTDFDGISDQDELQLTGPGPMNKNAYVYDYTQIYIGSDNDGADGRNASGMDGRPGIAWVDDDGDGEGNSPTNFYDVNGDGKFSLYQLDYRGKYIMEGLAPDDPAYAPILVDIPTTDTVDMDKDDNIPLIIGTEYWPDGEAKPLADGKDNDGDGKTDEDIDEKDEIAFSKDGFPGRPNHDDDGDSKDSDEDGYCDGQENRDGSDPYDAWDIPMHVGPDGKWVKDTIENANNWIDEPDEYGAPGSDDYSDDSADDDGLVDNPNAAWDRFNPDHDISMVGSVMDDFTGGAFRWMVPYFWRSHEYYMDGKGGLPLNSTCIPFVNWNPVLLDFCGVNWNQTVAARLFYKGAPYRWNMYDTDPRFDDTDTEVPKQVFNVACVDDMEDDWDPRPTIPDDRLDTHIAVQYIKNTETGESFVPEFGVGAQRPITWQTPLGIPTPDSAHDQYGFRFLLPTMTLEKGVKYEMSLAFGVEKCEPESKPIRAGWLNDYNISIGFHNISFGEDQTHYSNDDDYDGDDVPWFADFTPSGFWDYSPNTVSSGRGKLRDISIARQDLVADNVVEDMNLDPMDCSAEGCPWTDNYGSGRNGLEVAFLNLSVGASAQWSNITFYELKFFFYIPDGCPAGFLAFDVDSYTDENLWVYPGPWEALEGLTGVRYNALYN